jgi:hypothetical protein
MTSPKTPPLQPDPAAPRSRSIWIALGLYIAGGIATILLDRYGGGWGDGKQGSLVLLGPYGMLTEAVSTNITTVTIPLFAVASAVFLGFLLPAVAMWSRGLGFGLGVLAAVFWFFCGLIVDVFLHFTW